MQTICRTLLLLMIIGQIFAVNIEQAFEVLIDSPVDLTNDGVSDLLYVVSQSGVIYSIDPNDGKTKNVVLDITRKVKSGGELGLLGLAFHPDFSSLSKYFFVYYTASGPLRSVVSRFTMNDDNTANPSSELILLTFNQPYENHNGGQLVFGPDNKLYIASGDGGNGGDPQGNGQKTTTFLGKILRIDPTPSRIQNYSVPSDNPFVGNTQFLQEIWAYGLRNPWRISFDPVTGWLWAGDVGQNKWEEIDIITKGGNYGWNVLEGNECYGASSCDTSGKVAPVHVYGREEGGSVTGGHVYRGSYASELVGKYVFADFESGKIWQMEFDPSNPNGQKTVSLVSGTSVSISSFGVGRDNELYILSYGDGKIMRFNETPGSSTAASIYSCALLIAFLALLVL